MQCILCTQPVTFRKNTKRTEAIKNYLFIAKHNVENDIAF